MNHAPPQRLTPSSIVFSLSHCDPGTHAATALLSNTHAAAGNPIDPGLASYYASTLESELHPAWSMYHHQKQSNSLDAATHQRSAATEKKTLEQGTTSNALQSDETQAGGLVGLEQGGSPLGKIKQGLARTTQRIGQTLDQGRAAADRARESSVQFLRDRSSAWSSSEPDWKQNPSKADWPAPPATLGYADSACNTASQALTADSGSTNADAAADSRPALSQHQEETAEDAVAVDSTVPETAAPEGIHPHAEQLLSSFRLHSASQPSILSSLSMPITQNAPLHQTGAALSAGHVYCTESGIPIPKADTAGGIAQSTGQLNPAEHASYDQGSDWDATDVSKGLRGVTDPLQASQSADSSDRPSSPKQPLEGVLGDPLPPVASSGRLGRVRMGGANGREDAVLEPKYTPGVQAPPRGTLQISATAGDA